MTFHSDSSPEIMLRVSLAQIGTGTYSPWEEEFLDSLEMVMSRYGSNNLRESQLTKLKELYGKAVK